MFYSLTGILIQAKDENEANKQIFDINQTLFCYDYDLIKDSYGLASIIQVDDIEQFIEDFNKTLNNFLQNYKV